MSHYFSDRVMETSTSTGLGDITMAGAVTGYTTFASWLAANDTVDYLIMAVDSGGAPSGQWETGRGTWSGTTLQRTTFYNSSTGSAVDFSAGIKHVAITVAGYSHETMYYSSFTYPVAAATWTLENGQDKGVLAFSYAGAKTLTVPNDAASPFWAGYVALLVNTTAGDLTVAPAGGVTIIGATMVISRYSGAILSRAGTNSWYLLHTAPLRQRGAVVKKTADQTAADYSTAAVVAWTGEISDTDTIHDNATNNSRLTVPTDVTRVKLKANIELANLTADTWAAIKIRKNAAAFDGQGSAIVETGSTIAYLNAESAVVTVTAGDYFDVTLQAEDTSIDVVAAGSWFSMEIVL